MEEKDNNARYSNQFNDDSNIKRQHNGDKIDEQHNGDKIKEQHNGDKNYNYNINLLKEIRLFINKRKELIIVIFVVVVIFKYNAVIDFVNYQRKSVKTINPELSKCDKIYYENYKVISPDIDKDEFNIGMGYFKLGKYKEALSKFKEAQPRVSMVLFYSGQCYHELDEMIDAENMYIKVINGESKNYRAHAKWYLSLLYLKKQDKKQAYKVLESIVEEEGVYKLMANKVLKQLDKSSFN